MAIGAGHITEDTPFILAGGANGYFKRGQCIDAGAPHNKLLNSLLNAVGVRNNGSLVDNFGDASNPRGEHQNTRPPHEGA
jgi:hypothetical protein